MSSPKSYGRVDLNNIQREQKSNKYGAVSLTNPENQPQYYKNKYDIFEGGPEFLEDVGKSAVRGLGRTISEVAHETRQGPAEHSLPYLLGFGQEPVENYEWAEKLKEVLPEESESTPGRIVEQAMRTATDPRSLMFGPLGAAAGAVIGGAEQSARESGVPEDIITLGKGALAATGSVKGTKGSIAIEKATKPSGMTTRQFEKLNEPRQVSEGKLNQINTKLEKDFRQISDKIINESPVGETARNLKNDPMYKSQTTELFKEAQDLANSMEGKVPHKTIVNEYANISNKSKKGFMDNDYEESYSNYMNKAIGKIKEDVSYGQIVEQFRKNNAELSDAFDPSISRPANRAKKDALLDQNKALAKIIEQSAPESELSNVFKEGNNRWSKIMDAEALDLLVNDIFDGKINFKKIEKVLDSPKYGHILKRSLGKEGYKAFTQLLKDMSETGAGYKMLKVAKAKGWSDLPSTVALYTLAPKIGMAKAGLNLFKASKKILFNSMLDKPELVIKLKSGVNHLKKGEFDKAQEVFKEVNESIVRE